MADISRLDYANPFELPLSIVYRPPHSIQLLQILAFLCAYFAVTVAMLNPLVQWICYLLLSVYLMQHVGRFCVQYTGSDMVLHLTATDEWYLYKVTEKLRLTLMHDVLVHHQIVVLNFYDEAKRRHDFILTKENTDTEVLRILRVRLRYKK